MKQLIKIHWLIGIVFLSIFCMNNRAYSEMISCDPANPQCPPGWSCVPCTTPGCYHCAPPPDLHCSPLTSCASDGSCPQGYECKTLPGNILCCVKKTLVQLSTFEAKYTKGKVVVHWVTESEKDTAGFDVERSLKPDTGFVKRNQTMIPAKGDEVTGADYVFKDKDTKRQKYYYRLKEYETTGGVNYYGPIEIDLRGKGKTGR